MRKRIVVVVFDQVWQVGEVQLTVQVDAVLLSAGKRHGRRLEELRLSSRFLLCQRLINACQARPGGPLVSYLSEQPVVSGFTYADVPDHQHLNTKRMVR